jgi:glutathione-regulated potassium-efflux system ancillary protein KefG
MIDLQVEQRLCESHDVNAFQDSFYRYSTPSVMKEWLYLEHQRGFMWPILWV